MLEAVNDIKLDLRADCSSPALCIRLIVPLEINSLFAGLLIPIQLAAA